MKTAPFWVQMAGNEQKTAPFWVQTAGNEQSEALSDVCAILTVITKENNLSRGN
jgi:hypothetical protein